MKIRTKPSDERSLITPEGAKANKARYRRVVYAIAAISAVFLFLSIVLPSTILAMIGLSFLFGSILLMFMRPSNFYLDKEFVNSVIASSVISLSRLLSSLGYQARGTYVATANGCFFIPESKNQTSLVPTGNDLATLFEGITSNTNYTSLQKAVSEVLVTKLGLAKSLRISVSGNLVLVRLYGFLARELCAEFRKTTVICDQLGCPVCSAIACAVAKSTNEGVLIKRVEPSSDYRVIDVLLEKNGKLVTAPPLTRKG